MEPTELINRHIRKLFPVHEIKSSHIFINYPLSIIVLMFITIYCTLPMIDPLICRTMELAITISIVISIYLVVTVKITIIILSPLDIIDIASLNNAITSLSKNIEFICNLVRSADLSIYDDSSKQHTLSNTNNELISN